MKREIQTGMDSMKNEVDIIKSGGRATQTSEQMKIADDQMIQLSELIEMLFNRLQPVLIITNAEKTAEQNPHPQLVPLAQWMYEHNLNIKQACESIETIMQLMEI